jgi:ribosome-binding protein aMBF1 (putative translation factor)
MFLYTGFDLNSQLCVCHHCDNPPCVNPAHLFIGTHADNVHDRIKKGRSNWPKAENHCCAKLSNADVLVIRQLILDGISQAEIAHRFGVDPSAISNINRGKNWRSIVSR